MSFRIIIQGGKQLIPQPLVEWPGLEAVSIQVRMMTPFLNCFRFEQPHQSGAISLVAQGFLDPQQRDIHPPAETMGDHSPHHLTPWIAEENPDRPSQFYVPKVFKDVVPQPLQHDHLCCLRGLQFLGGFTDLYRKLLVVHCVISLNISHRLIVNRTPLPVVHSCHGFFRRATRRRKVMFRSLSSSASFSGYWMIRSQRR
jgi:hypothetical protein